MFSSETKILHYDVTIPDIWIMYGTHSDHSTQTIHNITTPQLNTYDFKSENGMWSLLIRIIVNINKILSSGVYT